MKRGPLKSVNDGNSLELNISTRSSKKNSKIRLSDWKWEAFQYDSIFQIRKGQRLTKANMTPGETPYVGASETSNGVTAYIGQQANHKGGTITVSYNGSIAEAFYQREPYWASDDVNVLYPRGFKITSYIAMFLCVLIRKEKFRFNYGRKWNVGRMKKSIIYLPVASAGVPDWASMEKYIKSLIGNTETPSNAPFSKNANINLSDRTWKAFKYGEIFDILGGYFNKKPREVPKSKSAIPFIGATEYNNGVTSWHTIEDVKVASKTGGADKNHDISKKIFAGGKYLTISNDGSVGYAFYQPKDFTCSHSVNPITTKGASLNPYVAMFLATLVGLERYRWAYGRKWRPIRMPSSIIKLPVDKKGNPDWQFMEDYIKSLPYSGGI